MIQVLIVDDDWMVADANKGYLESLSGFSCVGIANTAAQAIHLVETTEVDLVLLDIFMPGKSGIDLLREIRNAAQVIDVIIISAASDMDNIKTALRLGAVDYLIKPFEYERFHAALRAYQKEHRWMHEQTKISQTELDAVFLHQEKGDGANTLTGIGTAPSELPKGLTQATLKSVVQEIYNMDAAAFTTETLSNQVGISRVSIGKYLRFLTDISFLSSRLEYRSVGRPIYYYHLNPKNESVVQRYVGVD